MVRNVERMGERTGAYRALVGKPDKRNHLEDPGVDGRTILKWTKSYSVPKPMKMRFTTSVNITFVRLKYFLT